MVRTWTLILLCGFLHSADLADISGIQIKFLLSELSTAQYLAGGRLIGMPFPRARSESLRLNVRRDGLFSATNLNSVSQQRVLGFLYLLDGHLDKAEEVLRQLALEWPEEASIHNDLGVIRMGLAATDPMAWFSAIQEFKTALAKQPNLPEAKFNLILSYRHLRLQKLEAAEITDYQRIEPDLAWHLVLRDTGTAAEEVASLAKRIETAGREELTLIVKLYPADARQLVLELAFRPVLPIPSNYDRVVQELSDQYGDDTAKVAIRSISTNNIDEIARLRGLLQTGRKLFRQGRLDESRRTYIAAKSIADRIGSLFDQLWIEINDADIMVKLLDYEHAAAAYQHAVEIARRHHLQWVLARALSSIGSAAALSRGTVESMSRLTEAVQVYRSIGEIRECARPLYYLAGYHFMAASFSEGLKFAFEALDAADPSDHLRLTELHWLISRILVRMGYTEMATKFNEEATQHAGALGDPDVIASMRAQLASVYLMSNRNSEALEQLSDAERLLPKMSSEARDMTELSLNLIRGQIAIRLDHLTDAESEFRKNISFFLKHQAVNGTHTHAQSRMLLAKTLAARGDTTAAAQELREAIRLVEMRQNDLPQNDLQLTFDQDRRGVYDAAIDFEYDWNDCEESWNLTQGYKAKLFLNLLNGLGAVAGRLPTERLTLPQVKRRIPKDVQIVEYATLSNRLLIWVISKDHFQCRSTPVSAHQLREKINSFLSQLTQRQPTERSAQDLYDLLVEPIGEFLDSKRAVVIIPDGDLYRLPFSALQSRRDGRYWVETMPILESPSVTYLFSGSVARSLNSAHVAFGSRIQDAFTNAELNILQDIEPGIRLKVGTEVTKDAFLKALRDHSLFYYAGHSAFDMRNALQSAILLDGGRPGPNAVSALDIMRQRIPTNAMIILSSCETSSGNTIDGPGIRGLTSAFLVGGAGSVVGSIWPVESSGTMQLMSAVFKFLVADHRPIINSLQTAQIELIHHLSYHHPYYWSGFVVTGNLSAAHPHFFNTTGEN